MASSVATISLGWTYGNPLPGSPSHPMPCCGGKMGWWCRWAAPSKMNDDKKTLGTYTYIMVYYIFPIIDMKWGLTSLKKHPEGKLTWEMIIESSIFIDSSLFHAIITGIVHNYSIYSLENEGISPDKGPIFLKGNFIGSQTSIFRGYSLVLRGVVSG